MYLPLTLCHSLFRWLVLLSLFYAIFRAFKGYFNHSSFSRVDNLVRHWTCTIAHVQLIIGMVLYTQSPVIKYYWKNTHLDAPNADGFFFSVLHITLMLIAIIVITIGSAMAKRKRSDTQKFKTMLVWFSIALLIILIAIPWPFSPLASRPYFR